MIWIQFVLSGLGIVVAGTLLTRYADILCDRYRLGRFLIGILLLGMVTSLPELITSLVAVVRFAAADLAVGNVLGSNNFNPLLLIAMDVFYRRGLIAHQVTPLRSHSLSAGCAILLTGIVLFEIHFGAQPLWGSLSWGLMLVVVGYFIGVKLLSVAEIKPAVAETATETKSELPSLGKMWGMLVLSSALVLISSMFLTEAAESIAELTGWGQTFVGSLMLAVVTSLPEAVVTIAALRMGATEMAVGNIFGSNMFNITILAVCGVFHSGGLFLDAAAPEHMLTGLMSVVITGVALWGIHQKNKFAFLGLGVDSWMMLSIFLFGNYWIYGRPQG